MIKNYGVKQITCINNKNIEKLYQNYFDCIQSYTNSAINKIFDVLDKGVLVSDLSTDKKIDIAEKLVALFIKKYGKL